MACSGDVPCVELGATDPLFAGGAGFPDGCDPPATSGFECSTIRVNGASGTRDVFIADTSHPASKLLDLLPV